jgi:dihydrodipicolinate synthase/N-acetylneuraminate lyase
MTTEKKYKVVMDGCTRCKDGSYRMYAIHGTDQMCVQLFTQRGAKTVVRNLYNFFPKTRMNIEIKEVKG